MNALRAYESAARHLSFSLAAQELNVTPGAISQQIKSLETYLDIRLFRRYNRQILLTEAGQLLLPRLTTAFRLMGEAVDALRNHEQSGQLTISAPPSFVSKWLIPRLANFNHDYPDIDVRIDSSSRLVDYAHEDIDVGIRFSAEEDNELDSTHLMSLQVIPVCNPRLLTQDKGLRQVADLKHQTLLHYDSPSQQTWPDWAMWLATMNIDDVDASHGIYFNQPDMLIQAAIEGQGVALVATIFAENDIRQGRLVQPFDLSMPIRFSYYLVTTRQKARRSKVQAFKQWIRQQISAENEKPHQP